MRPLNIVHLYPKEMNIYGDNGNILVLCQRLLWRNIAVQVIDVGLGDDGVPMLLICGMYQMLGHYFKTQDGQEIPGIGILDLYTVGSEGRLIGNIVTQTEWGKAIGYENHSGRTYLGKKSEAFGTAKKGQGNNGSDGTEGAVWHNVFGSYLHGPLLSKAPVLADNLLELAIHQAGYEITLGHLDNSLEKLAAKTAENRPR